MNDEDNGNLILSHQNHQTNNKKYRICYHFNKALAQVKPLPKAAKQTKSPSFILPCS